MSSLPVFFFVAVCFLFTGGHAERGARQIAGDVFCPPGFQKLLGRNCYGHFTTPSTWTEAWTFCKSANTELLTIDDSGENQAVSQWITAKSTTDKAVWLSGNSMMGHWSWANGHGSWLALSFTSWAPGQPATPPGQQDGTFQCLVAENGQWRPASCRQSHAFVCKYEIDGLVSPDGMIAG
ncbi:hypothetical protein V1264_020377 [Littorina saxatilis]